MSLLVTVVGVFVGYHYATALGRRYGLGDRRRWLLLAPLWAGWLVVALTVGTADPLPRALEAAAIGSAIATLGDLGARLWRRRTPGAGAPATRSDDGA